MNRTRVLALAAVLTACASSPPVPPPTGVTDVAIAPVVNETGSALVIWGDSTVERWIGRKKQTVGDLIAQELEKTLRERGFAVGGPAAPRLKIVLRRFEPDLPQLAFVTVSLTATLADADGTVRWSEERTSWPVSTMGSPSLTAGYETAARGVAHGLVDAWQPAR